MSFAMLRFAFALLAVTVIVNADQCCDAGWSRTPEHTRCVKVSSQAMMWDQALAACQAMQGSLVSIRSSFENAFIWHLATQMPNVTFGAWIGGHTDTPMAHQTSGWTWTNGDPWNFAYWQTAQPSKPDNWQGCKRLGIPDVNQQCVEIWVWSSPVDHDSINVSFWNDQCCHRPLNFICEKPTVEKPMC